MVVFAGFQAYRAWRGEERKIPAISTVKETPSNIKKKMYMKKEAPATEYETVATNNLFAEDRAESKPEEPAKEPDAKPQADQKMMDFMEKEVEKIALYGILISENEKKALVSNLEIKTPTVNTRTPFVPAFLKRTVRNQKPAVMAPVSSGDKLKWVKQDDQIGRFKVTDIKNDSILLTAEGKEFAIFLYEKRGQKSVAPLKKDTGPVVVNVGPGAKTATAQVPVKPASTKQADVIKNIQKQLQPTTKAPATRGPAKRPN